MNKTIKIGNASGYWGDDPTALLRQLKGGKLDYITMDFLAEVTMSILQKQKQKDPKKGYAHDFLLMLREALPLIMQDKVKLITNAGGVNPAQCAQAIKDLSNELGLNPKIAIVYGDDILPQLDELMVGGAALKNMDTGANFTEVRDSVLSANIYFGAAPVVEALKEDPDIIITGRVTDTGITIAPMIHEFNWSFNDWNKLSSGIVAAHLLECGSQSSGGNFTDWEKINSFKNIGYPIVEVNQDSTFVISKHENTGGLISEDTVREQLFYEMGDPKAYLTPDVVADFSTIALKEVGENKVLVSNVKGFEPTKFYKVSIAYEEGFKSISELAICGPNAVKKAKKFAELIWERATDDFEATSTELFGYNAFHRNLEKNDDANEIILRLGIRDDDNIKVRNFNKMVPGLLLAGPPGVCVLGGVARVQKIVSYWPALIAKEKVLPKIAIYDNGYKNERTIATTLSGNFESLSLTKRKDAEVAVNKTKEFSQIKELYISDQVNKHPLSTICLTRSGDKGDTANIGVIARSNEAYEFLSELLSATELKNIFQELCKGKVTRYDLPNLLGFNFLLEQALEGGGTKALKTDAQGKTFAQGLLRIHCEIPPFVLKSVGL